MTDAKAIAEGLSEAQKQAIIASDHAPGLQKLGLVYWKQRTGKRFLSLALTPIGFEVRAYLIEVPHD